MDREICVHTSLLVMSFSLGFICLWKRMLICNILDIYMLCTILKNASWLFFIYDFSHSKIISFLYWNVMIYQIGQWELPSLKQVIQGGSSSVGDLKTVISLTRSLSVLYGSIGWQLSILSVTTYSSLSLLPPPISHPLLYPLVYQCWW